MTSSDGGTQDASQRGDRRGPALPPRRLVRISRGRMLAGVASGLAGYLGVEVLVVRIIFAALVLAGGSGLPIYLACWLLIPDEGTDQSIATEFTHDLQAWRH